MSELGKDNIRTLGAHYRTGRHDLRRDFFDPCFRHCLRYRRAAGYFASTALLSWLSGISRLVKDGSQLKIDLIVSHQLSHEDVETLRTCYDTNERRRLLELAVEKVLNLIIALRTQGGSHKERVELFAWLVAKGHLELKFAFPTHLDDAGIFHEKIGIFDFPWGDSVAFTGSANETGSGHSKNYESIDVYRSWISADCDRVETKSLQFEEAWNGMAE